jgi:hypothetical protein
LRVLFSFSSEDASHRLLISEAINNQTKQLHDPNLEIDVTELARFSHLLQEIQYFCSRRQKQVAKIVHCGEPSFLRKRTQKAICEDGLNLFAGYP